jgi:hypothetical protein
MSAPNRAVGVKTFKVIGYGGMGPSVTYGAVGTDEERLKVVFVFPIVVVGG